MRLVVLGGEIVHRQVDVVVAQVVDLRPLGTRQGTVLRHVTRRKEPVVLHATAHIHRVPRRAQR